MVESLDTEVVAFAPMLASHHPRVIAVGEGNGNLLRVTLLLSEECRQRRSTLSTTKQNKSNAAPLASALASIEVDFNNVDIVSKQEAIQNDGTANREQKKYRQSGDLADIIGECFAMTPIRPGSCSNYFQLGFRCEIPANSTSRLSRRVSIAAASRPSIRIIMASRGPPAPAPCPPWSWACTFSLRPSASLSLCLSSRAWSTPPSSGRR